MNSPNDDNDMQVLWQTKELPHVKVEKLDIGSSSVVIDPVNLTFSEATLSSYIETEAGYYDNFGAYLALAEKNLQIRELEHERLFHSRYIESKDIGGTEKYCEAKAKTDPDVVSLKEKCVDAKYMVTRLKQHLRAWDKNHDNAQSLGHMLRKTMDKLNSAIFAKVHGLDPNETLDQTVGETCPSATVVDVNVDDTPQFAEDDLGISDLL